MTEGKAVKLVILLSGGGRSLQNFIDKIRSGALNAIIVGVISSRREVLGVERAKQANLPCQILRPKDFKSSLEYSDAISKTLDVWKPDLVCAAGFLSLYIIPKRWMGRCLNIHPALLPRYGGKGMYGDCVHEAVLKSGDNESGCTVHYMSNEYDAGEIILQKKVPVLPNDTVEVLAARVFSAECDAYPEAVQMAAKKIGKENPR